MGICFRRKWVSACFLALAATVGLNGQAAAASLILGLTQDSLTDVDDAAGRWQHEGGRIFVGKTLGGYYAAHRRVTTSGTTAQNTAMLTITLFELGDNPPENVTIQGSHDFDSGDYIGSVSAASDAYFFLIGADVTGSTATDTLTLSW